MGAGVSRRIFNVMLALDQFLFCVLTLGNADPDESASAAAWRTEQKGRLLGRLFRPIIDWLFIPWQVEHCRHAFEAEMAKAQLPPEYRVESSSGS